MKRTRTAPQAEAQAIAAQEPFSIRSMPRAKLRFLPARTGALQTDELAGRYLHQKGSAARLNKGRLFGVHAATLLTGGLVYRQFNRYFGGIAQPFKIGNDWRKDHAMFMDELLHFQGSYRLTQAITELYRWAGVRRGRAEAAGAALTAAAMTFLEYVDGRRFNDEASYSDLTANFLGITFALLKPRVPLLRAIDFHVSYRGMLLPLGRRRVLDYSRIIHWMSLDFARISRLPFRLGIGYGVANPFRANVRPRFFLGLGVGLGRLLRGRAVHLSGPFGWLDVYRFGLQVQIAGR